MHIPRGNLKKLESITNIAASRLCDYAATRVRPRPKRAEFLASACEKLGLDCPAATWLLGSSDEIKRCLTGRYPDDKRKNERRSGERRSKPRRRSHDRRHG